MDPKSSTDAKGAETAAAPALRRVALQWAGNTLQLGVDVSKPVRAFLFTIQARTGVPLDRQKLLLKRGGRVTSASTWSSLGLRDGDVFLLFGNVERRAVSPGDDSFSVLADELVILIFSFLDIETLARARAVCRRWHRLATDDQAWRPWAAEFGFREHFDLHSVFSRRFNALFDWRRGAVDTVRLDLVSGPEPSPPPNTLLVDGALMVTSTRSRVGEPAAVRCWDFATGRVAADVVVAGSSITAVCKSGNCLWIGTRGDGLRVWDLASVRCKRHVPEPTTIGAIAFACGGTHVAMTVSDTFAAPIWRRVALVDAETQALVCELGGAPTIQEPESPLRFYTCVSDGLNLLAGRSEQGDRVVLWDARVRDVLDTIECVPHMSQASASLAVFGHNVVVGDVNGAAVFDMRHGVAVPLHRIDSESLRSEHSRFSGAHNVAIDATKIGLLHTAHLPGMQPSDVVSLHDVCFGTPLCYLDDRAGMRSLHGDGHIGALFAHDDATRSRGSSVLHLADDLVVCASARAIVAHGRALKAPSW
eukprot:Amastigsp_a842679_8.p1 type:complete len:533 gc:universal Amastigsp_a842679_8:54-1652(+)